MTKQEDEDRHWQLLWNTRLGIRYHTYRQGFYERLGKAITFFTLVTSSGAFTTFINANAAFKQYGAYLALAAATLQLLELIIDTKSHSILHLELKQKYLSLESDLTGKVALSLTDSIPFDNARIEIERREPPVYKSLMALCHNDLVRVVKGSKSEDIVKMNVFTMFSAKTQSLTLF